MAAVVAASAGWPVGMTIGGGEATGAGVAAGAPGVPGGSKGKERGWTVHSSGFGTAGPGAGVPVWAAANAAGTTAAATIAAMTAARHVRCDSLLIVPSACPARLRYSVPC